MKVEFWPDAVRIKRAELDELVKHANRGLRPTEALELALIALLDEHWRCVNLNRLLYPVTDEALWSILEVVMGDDE